MAMFNYISTLRTNCTPADECETQICQTFTCEDFRNCLGAYYDAPASLWYTGVDIVIEVHNVGDGACEYCDSVNGTYPACAGVPFDWFGDNCVISNRLWGAAPAACDQASIQWVNIQSFSKDGLAVDVSTLYTGARYELTGDDWQLALVQLCAGDEITLPLSFIREDFGITTCDYTSSYVTVQLFPAGESGCTPPPPATNICAHMIDCPSDPPLLVAMSYFENFDEPEAAGGSFSGTCHWMMENLNRGYVLPYTGGGTYEFEEDLVASIGDHDDPGIPLSTLTPDDTDYDLERYVHKVLIRIVCVDGEAYIDYVNFYFQEFIKTPGDPGVWTANGDNILWQATAADLEQRSDVGVCYMPLASAFFYFENFLTAGKGDESHLFLVSCTLGSSA